MANRSKRVSSEYFFEPQSKKVLNDESEEYMRSVYEKTMLKLKNGAKLNNTSKPISDTVTPTKNSSLQTEVKRGLKQISLSASGQLDSESKITNPKEFYPMLPEKCCFCERLGCFTNLSRCSECKECFCDNCSFSTFVTFEGCRTCKSCFR